MKQCPPSSDSPSRDLAKFWPNRWRQAPDIGAHGAKRPQLMDAEIATEDQSNSTQQYHEGRRKRGAGTISCAASEPSRQAFL